MNAAVRVVTMNAAVRVVTMNAAVTVALLLVAIPLTNGSGPPYKSDNNEGSCVILLRSGGVLHKNVGDLWIQDCVTLVCLSKGNYRPVHGKSECPDSNGACHPVQSVWTEKDKRMYECHPGLVPYKVVVEAETARINRG